MNGASLSSRARAGLYVALAVAGAIVLVHLLPGVLPTLPDRQLNRAEAIATARSLLAEIDPTVADTDLAAVWEGGRSLEYLHRPPAATELPWARWWVVAPESEGRIAVGIGIDGTVVLARARPDEAAEAEAPGAPTLAKAVDYARQRDLISTSTPAPEVELVDGRWEAQFTTDREQVRIFIDGDRITGFYRAPLETIDATVPILIELGRSILLFVILLLLAGVFPTWYYSGQIRRHRGFQVALLCGGACLLWLVISMPGLFLDLDTAGLVFMFTFLTIPIGVMVGLAFVATSVGEAACRHRWPDKLDAFETICRGRLLNATVAWSSLRGIALGLAAAAVVIALAALLGITIPATRLLTRGLDGSLPFFDGVPISGLRAPLQLIGFELPVVLTATLTLPALLARRLPRGAAIGVALLFATLLLRPIPLPFELAMAPFIAIALGCVPLVIFLRFDLLSAGLAYATAHLSVHAVPLLTADDPVLTAMGALMLLPLLPFVLSLVRLGDTRTFSYRFDPLAEAPKNIVEAIAEQERRRLELDTGREVQTAILPKLPPDVFGIDVMGSYRPAAAVGADFYHLEPLADGRIAGALGDVAGTGLSSGLVMTRLLGALAMQLRFDPSPNAVFATLHRLTDASARHRLFATLAYFVLDPTTRDLSWTSSGQPLYRLTHDGGVELLTTAAPPLGTRLGDSVVPRSRSLFPGDSIVALSNGVITAPSPSGDPFGYHRVELTLSAHTATQSLAELVESLLTAVERHTGGTVPHDDYTVLALQLPNTR
ncbi:MAG: SpoIIE family protein phosphatase [Acidobacteriota bacterium]